MHVWLRLFGPRWMVETCEEAHSHPFKKGLHAGCVVEAMWWAACSLSLGRLGTWTWPSHFLPWGLPAWSCSHDCSCHLCTRSCLTLGIWTCSLWAEGGNWMSCQAPDSSEDRSSSHSAALTQKPWTSKARGPVDLLQSRGASDQVIEAARHFQCTACLRYKRPNQVAPLPCDLKPTKLVNACRPMCCGSHATPVPWSSPFSVSSTRPPATKHTAAALLHGERSDHLIQGLERAWIRHSRLPQSLCSDEGRGWAGEEMNAWTTQHSVEHIVAHRLALVERAVPLRFTWTTWRFLAPLAFAKRWPTWCLNSMTPWVWPATRLHSGFLERCLDCQVDLPKMDSALHTLETTINSNNF